MMSIEIKTPYICMTLMTDNKNNIYTKSSSDSGYIIQKMIAVTLIVIIVWTEEQDIYTYDYKLY